MTDDDAGFLSALWAVVDRWCAITAAHQEVQSLETAEAVILSRVAVHQLLVAAGWQPPTRDANAVSADQLLLLARGGAIPG